MPTSLPPELYYLSNFRTALAWIGERSADLLSDEERKALHEPHLPMTGSVHYIVIAGLQFHGSSAS